MADNLARFGRDASPPASARAMSTTFVREEGLARLAAQATVPVRAVWRSRFRSYGLLCAAVLLFTCCLLFSFQRVKQHHAIELMITDAVPWRVSRAEFELERLRHALDAYALGLEAVDHDDLLQRYDVFMSAIPPLLYNAEIADAGERASVVNVPRLIDGLERIEPEILGLSRGDRAAHQQLSYRLGNLAPPLHHVASEIRASLRERAAGRSALRLNLYLEQTVYLFGILASGGFLISLLFREIRKIRRLLDESSAARIRVEHLAHHDPLTDVPNRWLLNDRLEQALRRAGRDGELVALLYVDLDHFKDINDTLGHIAGDQLLIALAWRLRSCLRESDTLARIGGDEFAIVQTGVMDTDGAVRLSRRLLRTIRPPVMLGARPVRISVSIGIGIYPLHGSTARELHQAADVALYRAKSAGRAAFRMYEQPGEGADRILLHAAAG
jgi:diguanylate cyclase (GGDEF)-like protein